MKKQAMWWLGERQYLENALFIHALTCEEAKDIRAYGVTAPDRRRAQRDRCQGAASTRDRAALFARAPELAGRRVFMFMGRVAPIQKGLDLLVQGLVAGQHP